MLRITFVTFFSPLLLMIGCKNGPSCPTINSGFYASVYELSSEDEIQKYITKLNRIIKKNGNCVLALQTRGYLYFKQRNVEESFADFLRVSRINNKSPFTSYYLSRIYNIKNDNDSALFYLNRAFTTKTRNGVLVTNLIPYADELDVDVMDLIYLRGMIYFDKDQLNTAKRDFLLFVKNYPDDPEGNDFLTNIYYKLGNLDSACFFYQKRAKIPESAVDSILINRCN